MADGEGEMPWRTLQLLAFISCIHVIVNIVNKKTTYFKLITLEENFFLSLLLHIVKIKKTPLGHRSTVFLEKTRFITFISRTVRKDVYRKCLQSRCFGIVTSSKMAIEIDAILDLLKITIHQKSGECNS